MQDFKIRFLDHVAIRVKNLEKSANWYEKVLGLKKYQLEAWGEFPIFMLAGKTGIALFPADSSQPDQDTPQGSIRIDHFAFNVSNTDFQLAREKYDRLKIDYHFSNHTYFLSLYTRDPDGHEVELTTIVMDEADFYK